MGPQGTLIATLLPVRCVRSWATKGETPAAKPLAFAAPSLSLSRCLSGLLLRHLLPRGAALQAVALLVPSAANESSLHYICCGLLQPEAAAVHRGFSADGSSQQLDSCKQLQTDFPSSLALSHFASLYLLQRAFVVAAQRSVRTPEPTQLRPAASSNKGFRQQAAAQCI